MKPEGVGLEPFLVQSDAVLGGPSPCLVGLDPGLVRSAPDLGGLEPDLVRLDPIVFVSDAFGFPSDAVLGRLKLCGVGSEKVGFRAKTVGVESALEHFRSARVGILSRGVGILSAGVGFQSAACLFGLAVAERRETAGDSLDSASGPPDVSFLGRRRNRKAGRDFFHALVDFARRRLSRGGSAAAAGRVLTNLSRGWPTASLMSSGWRSGQ